MDLQLLLSDELPELTPYASHLSRQFGLPIDGEDLLQNCAIRLLRHRKNGKQIRGDESPAVRQAFLKRALRSAALDALRHEKRRRVALSLAGEYVGFHSAIDQLEASEAFELISMRWESLGVAGRFTWLVLTTGLSKREVADLFGHGPEYAHKLFTSGIHKLRLVLDRMSPRQRRVIHSIPTEVLAETGGGQ